MEFEGEELEQNLMVLRAEVEALRCPTKYEEVSAALKMTMKDWQKVESNRALGYTRNSIQTAQQNMKAACDCERECITVKKSNDPQVLMMWNWVAQAPKAHTKPTVKKWPHTHSESAGNPAPHESLAHIFGYLSDLSMDTEDKEDTTESTESFSHHPMVPPLKC
ncbi:uncharacterized protein BJ212DRAFT_1296335 [Suillus subaureus]|uniref:Uncharacterized protein n=1 Tax=Suillus subaureus TaxID=48587 RepID=A0A9P7JI96_9AGAM|nr:uncharacterized protein BJ212DRAFT_1296335 [Suillus subaureus]KAG1823784.1 hypothetical protein BJ212DRAFT_1296335 [Suillus subaureus]